jgi:hypothetical protein
MHITTIEEEIKHLKKLEEHLRSNMNMTSSYEETYKKLIKISKEHPELTNLIEFITFLEDKMNTENAHFKNHITDVIRDVIRFKISNLERVKELTIKINPKSPNNKVKEILLVVIENKVLLGVMSITTMVFLVHFLKDDFLVVMNKIKELMVWMSKV